MVDSKTAKRVWGSFTTLAPLTQSSPGGVKEGIGGYTRTRTWPGLGGVRLPIYSGNGIRGRVRRVMAEEMFRQVGVGAQDLRPVVAHLFLVGGSLAKDAQKTLTPETERAIKSLFPPLALMGGTVLSTITTGRLRVGDFVALTQETYEPYLQALGADRESLPSAKDVLFVDYHVRSGRDLAEYWTDEELAAEGAEDTEDAEDAGNGTSAGKTKNASSERSMPHGIQGVIPGVTFVGSIGLADYRGLDETDDTIQRSCLRLGLETAFPDAGETTLGLGAANGRGSVEFAWGEALDAICSEDPPGEAYLAHIEEHRDEMRDKLLSGDLVPKRKAAPAPVKAAETAGGSERKRGRGR